MRKNGLRNIAIGNCVSQTALHWLETQRRRCMGMVVMMHQGHQHTIKTTDLSNNWDDSRRNDNGPMLRRWRRRRTWRFVRAKTRDDEEERNGASCSSVRNQRTRTRCRAEPNLRMADAVASSPSVLDHDILLLPLLLLLILRTESNQPAASWPAVAAVLRINERGPTMAQLRIDLWINREITVKVNWEMLGF